jgi:hypothetical protein
MSTAARVASLFAAGVLAGVLCPAPASAAGAVPLNAGQESPGARSGGSGFISYTTTADQLCYTLSVRNLTAAPVAAHIHLAPRNVAGPVVVPLLTPPAATSSVSECITAAEGGALTPAELAAIAADPGAYYANVHTPMWPAGEVRGQLK